MDKRVERAQWLAHNILPHEANIRSWLYRIIRHSIDADDVVQEAYARLSAMETVANIHNPRAYFFQTVISILKRETRRELARPFEINIDVHQVKVAAHDIPADRQYEAREDLSRLIAAVETLPPKCRQVFIMRRVQGMAQRDIASALEISENTVEKHINRAIKLLTSHMEPAERPARAPAEAHMGNIGLN